MIYCIERSKRIIKSAVLLSDYKVELHIHRCAYSYVSMYIPFLSLIIDILYVYF